MSVAEGLQRQINSISRRLERTETWEQAAGGGGGASEPYRTYTVAASDAENSADADYTCDGVDDEAEINSALSAVTTSGFRGIRLTEGTFEVNQSAAISIPGNNIIIDGQGDATVLNINTGTNSSVNCSGRSNITFSNMRITGGGASMNRIFRLNNGCTNITFENITFDGVVCTAFTAYIIRLENSWQNITIKNCRFIDKVNGNADACIGNWATAGQDAAGIKVINNYFACKSSGIFLPGNASGLPADPDDLTITDIEISGNIFDGSNAESSNIGTFCRVEWASNISITDNVIRECVYGIFVRDAFFVTIDGNTVRDITTSGIHATNSFGAENNGGSRFLTISDNSVSLSSGNLISVVGPFDGSVGSPSRTNQDYRSFGAIVGNNCYASGAEGVTLQLCAQMVVAGNIIVGDYESATPTGIPAGVYVDEGWDILVEDNVISYWDVGVQCIEGNAADYEDYDTVIRGNYIAYNAEQGVSLHGVREFVVDGNYFIGNGSKTNNTYSHIEIDRESPSSTNSDNITISDNKFHEGYAANKAQYCINLGLAGKELTATGILIKENDFRSGAVTAAINSILTTPPEVYDNWTDGGHEAKLSTGIHTELTISGGVVSAVEQSDYIKLQPETGNTDDLDTITANTWDEGRMLVLSVKDAADTITVKDATGNLNLAGDFALDSRRDRITLQYDTDLSEWCEIARSNNA